VIGTSSSRWPATLGGATATAAGVSQRGESRVARVGFSLSELDDAGINIEQAERLGLPVDASRVGVYGPNVSALREFARSARNPA